LASSGASCDNLVVIKFFRFFAFLLKLLKPLALINAIADRDSVLIWPKTNGWPAATILTTTTTTTQKAQQRSTFDNRRQTTRCQVVWQ